MTPIEKTFCTTREAATLLGVSISTVQNWSESGLLDSWKTEGGHRRITRESVSRLLAKPVTHRAIMHTTPPLPQRAERLRVLVVEDNFSLLRLYQIRMSNWSLAPQVETAADGFEGLVKIGLQRPDLLITDLQMPHLDGFQMIESLRRMPLCADLQIIVVTGLSPSEIAQEGGLPEGVPVFPKPAPFLELERIAKNVLTRKHARPAAARAA